MSRNAARERIIAAAEELFAQHGFAGTTTRAITRKAAVNIAAVNYHFKTKELLAQAVFERRLKPLNDERLARLEAIIDTAKNENIRPLVMDVLKAFVVPLFEHKEADPKIGVLLSLACRSLFGAAEPVKSIFLNTVNPVFTLFFQCMEEALPGLPRQDVISRCRLAISTTGSALLWFDEDASPGDDDVSCPGVSVESLLVFLAAGLEASVEKTQVCV